MPPPTRVEWRYFTWFWGRWNHPQSSGTRPTAYELARFHFLAIQDAIFFNEIGDGMGLVPVDPRGEPGDQAIENHRPTSDGTSRRQGSVQYTLNRKDFNWVETTEFFNTTRYTTRPDIG